MDNLQLSPAEQGYFIACTDIFHDTPYDVIGRPSVSNQLQNTVVMNLEKTITQSSFPALNPANNWSCNIVSLPFLTTKTLTTTVDNGYTITRLAAPTDQTWGGVMAFGSAVGASTINPASEFVGLNGNTFFYPEFTGSATDHVPRSYHEILSIGIEIINATPELYKSGNVTRYRVPTQGRAVSLPITAGDPRAIMVGYSFPLPPTTEALATQYPDSIIDEASAGSYQMHCLQDQVSDYFVAGNSPIHFTSPVPAAPLGFNTWTSLQPYTGVQVVNPPLIRGDFDMVGSYFTGLSPQTVLKIRYRAIVSLVPSSTDSALISLAKMSPPPNDALNALIYKVQSTFSPGIKASMNASGDWWRIVGKGVAKYAKPIGRAIGGPVGEDIGGGISALAGMTLKKKKQKKPEQNKITTVVAAAKKRR